MHSTGTPARRLARNASPDNSGPTCSSYSLQPTWISRPDPDRFGFQGEFFTGENLGAYLGGIIQGINTTTGEPIRATGGWFELWYDWTDRVHSHVGYSIDDPINVDVTDGRTYNQFVFANISRNLTDKFLVGFEYTSWRTLYDVKRPGESDRFEFVAKYGF